MFGNWSVWLIVVVLAGLLLGGSYIAGKTVGYDKGYAVSEKTINDYKDKNVELTLQIDANQQDINNKIRLGMFDRVKVIYQDKIVYQAQADKLVPLFNMSNGWIDLHDAAISGKTVSEAQLTDNTPSAYKDNYALGVIASNYQIDRLTREKLQACQQWYIDTKANIDAINAKNIPVKSAHTKFSLFGHPATTTPVGTTDGK